MAICECILSDDTFVHVEIIQKLLKKGSYIPNDSDVVEILLKYILSKSDIIPLDEFIIIDKYFLEHPDFLCSFYRDVMMSATFYLN